MPCILARKVTLDKGKDTFHLETAAEMGRPWTLVVRVDGEEIYRQDQVASSATPGWIETNLSLEAYRGREVLLEVINLAYHSNPGIGLIGALALE
jgi:hypothetical protein